MTQKTVMVADDIRRTLARMSHEIIEHTKTLNNLLLVGMHTRGVPLAHRLAEQIEHFEKVKVPVGTLDIGLYRDDILSLNLKPTIKRTDIPTGVDGRVIILVDDVLYTGRSIRAAMDALIDLGRPRSIQLAVLVDRGHRELPIRADYVGKNFPSSLTERVRVNLKEVDGTDEVVIITGEDKEGT